LLVRHYLPTAAICSLFLKIQVQHCFGMNSVHFHETLGANLFPTLMQLQCLKIIIVFVFTFTIE
jgi:hypothetical protein